MAASMPSSLELYGVPDELDHPTCVAARPAAERWKCAFPQYVLEVLEDAVWVEAARAAGTYKTYKAPTAEENGITKQKQESCSCIEGNPCADAYCCKDWKNRFEVAKRNGWKGHS